MKHDSDGVGFLRFMRRWLGKRHPFDTLVVNMDFISKPEVQAAVASFAQMDSTKYPHPNIHARHSTSSSPTYSKLKHTAALNNATDFLAALPPVMYLPRGDSCCAGQGAAYNPWIYEEANVVKGGQFWPPADVTPPAHKEQNDLFRKGLDMFCGFA